jgi:DNA polymerase I-like protein with 3'-5' exonuclease and polymerase domains
MAPDVRRYLVDTADKLRKAWKFIATGDEPIGFDLETVGPNIKWRNGKTKPDAYRHRIAGFSLSRGNFAIYVPVRHRLPDIQAELGFTPPTNVPLLLAFEVIKELLELARNGRRVWVHNLAYELNVLINEGLWAPHTEIPRALMCSQVAVWLAYTKRGKDVALKRAAGWLLGLQDLQSFDKVANGRDADIVPPEEMAPYAALDAWLTVAAGEKSYARLEAYDLTNHYHDMDMPLVEITRGMARAGMARDRAELERLRGIWVERRDAAAKEFEELTACEVEVTHQVPMPIPDGNGGYVVVKSGPRKGEFKLKKQAVVSRVTKGVPVNKDDQVSRRLYEVLKWWPIPEVWDRRKGEYVGLSRNGKGVYSVKAQYVKKFVGLAGAPGRAAQCRMEYQKYAKLISTYLDPIIMLPDQYGDDLIHPSLNVTGTMTQRFSGSGPNFQNIPSRDITGKEIRLALLAPRPGWLITVRDYSQIELRLQADIANDEPWMTGYTIEADLGVKFDLHQQAADELSVLLSQKISRGIGKIVNLSVQYGVSAETLVVHIASPNIDREMCQKIIDAFYELHPGIRKYQKKAEKFAIKNGFIPTKDGFKRFGFKAKWLYKEQRHGLTPHDARAASNTPVQGWSGGIMKASMVDLWRKWTSEGIYDKYVLLLNSVHDEIAAGHDPSPELCARVANDMDVIMAKPRWGIRVATPVEGGTGRSWAEAK